ncbi:MAG: lysylphosphatidylglycerol synthase transmembrane domain-containing protein [bacterium]
MKGHILRIGRIVLGVALLFWVLRQVHWGDLKDKLAHAKHEWVLAALLVSTAANLLGAWRWQLLLASLRRRVAISYLFGSYFVGLFFNNFLPSNVGGDVVRAAGARKKGGGSFTEHLTVVLVERMIGLLATLCLGGVAAAAGHAKWLGPRVTEALIAALVVSAVGLYLALSAPVRHLAARLLPRVPIAFVRRVVAKMLGAFELFSKAPGALAANFALSVGFQFLLIVHFWLIQFAFGGDAPFRTFLVVVPLVFTAMMLPVGINGLGVREWAFVALLTRAGFEPATALALSLASYGIAVLQGLIGGIVHVTREIAERAQPAAPIEPRTNGDEAAPGR